MKRHGYSFAEIVMKEITVVMNKVSLEQNYLQRDVLRLKRNEVLTFALDSKRIMSNITTEIMIAQIQTDHALKLHNSIMKEVSKAVE